MSKLEQTDAPKIGGTLPHDHYITALHSIAISLKRIADVMEKDGGRSHFEKIFGK